MSHLLLKSRLTGYRIPHEPKDKSKDTFLEYKTSARAEVHPKLSKLKNYRKHVKCNHHRHHISRNNLLM